MENAKQSSLQEAMVEKIQLQWFRTKHAQREIGLTGTSSIDIIVCKDVLFQLKNWNQLNHQPVLKLPHFFPASLQAKTAGISKLVDDKAGSIL